MTNDAWCGLYRYKALFTPNCSGNGIGGINGGINGAKKTVLSRSIYFSDPAASEQERDRTYAAYLYQMELQPIF